MNIENFNKKSIESSSKDILKLLEQAQENLKRAIAQQPSKEEAEQAKTKAFLERVKRLTEQRKDRSLSEIDTEISKSVSNLETALKIPSRFDIRKLSEEEVNLLIQAGIVNREFYNKFLSFLDAFKEAKERHISMTSILDSINQINASLQSTIVENKNKLQELIDNLKTATKQRTNERYKKRAAKVSQKLNDIKSERISEVETAERHKNQELFLELIRPAIRSFKDRFQNSFERILKVLGSEGIIGIVGLKEIKERFNIKNPENVLEFIENALNKPDSLEHQDLLNFVKDKIVVGLTEEDAPKKQSLLAKLRNVFEESILYETGDRQIKDPLKEAGKKEKIVPWIGAEEYIELVNLFQRLEKILEKKDGQLLLDFNELRNLFRKLRRDVGFLDSLLESVDMSLQKGEKITPAAIIERSSQLKRKIKPAELNLEQKINQLTKLTEFKNYIKSFLNRRMKSFDIVGALYNSNLDIILENPEIMDDFDKNFIEEIKKIIQETASIIKTNNVFLLLFGPKTGKWFWDALKQREQNDKTGQTKKLIEQKIKEQKRREEYYLAAEQLKNLVQENQNLCFVATNHVVKTEDGKQQQVTIGILIEQSPSGTKIKNIISPDDPNLVSRIGIKEGQHYVQLPQWLKELINQAKSKKQKGK